MFKMLRGVESVTPGYAGGSLKNPSYFQVSTGKTGHAEVIKIEFNPQIISYQDLLDIFLHAHDPTAKDRQGNDIGTQYRSIILYADDEQQAIAKDLINKLNRSGEFKEKIVTELGPLKEFYQAEDYHKDYYEKNPDQSYCQLIISPKLRKLERKYSKKLK